MIPVKTAENKTDLNAPEKFFFIISSKINKTQIRDTLLSFYNVMSIRDFLLQSPIFRHFDGLIPKIAYLCKK